MIKDSGAQLRALYEAQGGVGAIFSDKVADYLASRPDYPAPLFAQLRERCHLFPGAVVADIGAGTGLLTQGLLAAGYNVVAVEPNLAMRFAADSILGPHAGYRSVAGTAEAIPLASSSVDLITAAQAFHWFEVERAKAECLRVLRPYGQVALIWNDRVLTEALHIALDELFAKYGGAKRGALVSHQERGDVPRFFGVNVAAEFSWPNQHVLNESGLLSLVFSRSYMPERNSALGQQAMHEVQRIFQQFASNDKLLVSYTTVAMIGRPG